MLKRSSLILALLFAFTMLPVFGQAGNIINTKIPFSFIVDGRVLPAGDYQLMQPTADQDDTWIIRNLKNPSTEAMFTTEREDKVQPRADTYVAFKEVNHKNYLSDIWTEGSVQGWHVPVALELGATAKMHNIKASLGMKSSS